MAGGSTLVKAAEPNAPADHKIKVFVSCSPKDLDFAQRIVAALEARGITAEIDTPDLPKWNTGGAN
jgi:hypothetical protein